MVNCSMVLSTCPDRRLVACMFCHASNHWTARMICESCCSELIHLSSFSFDLAAGQECHLTLVSLCLESDSFRTSQGRFTSSTYFGGTPPWFDSDRIGVECPRVEVEVSDIVSLACELLMSKSFSVVDDPTVLDIARKLDKDPEQ